MNRSLLVLSLNPTLQKTTLFPQGWKRGQVNRSSQYSLTVSGKGANTARILAQLEENVTYLTPLGGRNREFFLEELRKEGIKVVWDDSGSEIRYCQTLISLDPLDVTEIVEAGEPVSPQTDSSIRDHLTESMSVADWVILTGSKAPGFSDTIYLDSAREAAEMGVPVIIDMNSTDLPAYLELKPRLIKNNAYEFCQSFLPELKADQEITEEQVLRIEEKLSELSADKTDFVITQGPGEILVAHKGSVKRVTPPKMNVVNPIGCGDAMTAGMASGLSRGLSLEESLELAMECSRKNGELLAVGTILPPPESSEV